MVTGATRGESYLTVHPGCLGRLQQRRNHGCFHRRAGLPGNPAVGALATSKTVFNDDVQVFIRHRD